MKHDKIESAIKMVNKVGSMVKCCTVLKMRNAGSTRFKSFYKIYPKKNHLIRDFEHNFFYFHFSV